MVSIAQIVRAILLASAIATSMRGFFPGIFASHEPSGIERRARALMGAGDWNDGMDRVGEKGRGRSVSLSWEAGAVNFRAHRQLSNSIIHGADATPVTVNGGS